MKRAYLTSVLIITFSIAGCTHKPQIKSLPRFPERTHKSASSNAFQEKNKPELKRMGYTVQVGAFRNFENALRLTKALEKKGLDAFYYKNEAGLFRVRFGDYKTMDEAKKAAQAIVESKTAESFSIISPGEYIQSIRNIHVARKPYNITGDSLRDQIAATANGFIGLPYQWGDISPTRGFDCSSFVMAVYQLNGLVVPRTSEEQFKNGLQIEADNLQRGDLLFFATNNTGRISHVGIYIGDGLFIHAPGKGKEIREESLNTAYYRERYMGACTYLN